MSLIKPRPERARHFNRGAADPYAAYLAYDSFDEAAATNLEDHTPEKGGAWTKTGGAISIVVDGGEAVAPTNAGTEYGYYLDVGVADVTITLPLTTIRASYQGIMFNWVDASNFWWFGPSVNNGVWFVFRVSGGTPTSINSDAGLVPTDGSSAVISVITDGDTITCKRDGVTSYSATIAGRPHKTATRHGLYTGYNILTQVFGQPFTIEP